MRDEQRPVDEAIDEAARALTAGQPGASLRARVAERIAGGQRQTWNGVWPLGASAAVVIVIAALLWPFPASGPADFGSVTSVERPTPTADDVVRAPEQVQAPSLAESPPPVREAVARERPVAGRAVEDARAESMPVTEPMVVDPLELNVLGVDAIDFPVLRVEALAVEPLAAQ